MPARKNLPDLALGPEEAAAILGVHWSRPSKMVDRGEIGARETSSNDDGSRVFRIFSLRECEEDYQRYLRLLSGQEEIGIVRRPRSRVDDREPVYRVLSDAKLPQIVFGDAIGTYEAAAIIGVWPTYVRRLVAQGRLIGRIAWSQRSGDSRMWIISRSSAEELAAAMSREEKTGKHHGRPRTGPYSI